MTKSNHRRGQPRVQGAKCCLYMNTIFEMCIHSIHSSKIVHQGKDINDIFLPPKPLCVSKNNSPGKGLMTFLPHKPSCVPSCGFLHILYMAVLKRFFPFLPSSGMEEKMLWNTSLIKAVTKVARIYVGRHRYAWLFCKHNQHWILSKHHLPFELCGCGF